MFTIKTLQVAGMPTESVWSQAHTFSNLFLIVTLSKKDENVNLAAAGKQFFLRVEHAYSEEKEKDLTFIKSIFQKVIEETNDCVIVSVAAGMVVEKALYLVARNARILLNRRGIGKTVLEASEQFVSASGFLENGDTIVFMSNKLADVIAIGDKEKIFTLGVPEITEALSTFIHGQEGREHCVACIVKVAKMEGPQEPQREPDVLPVGAKPKSRAKQVMLTVFFILAILFVVSLALGITKREREKHTTRFANAYREAQQAYDEGVALVDLNPVLAQKTLARAEGIVSKELETLSGKKSKEGEMMGKLKKDIEVALKKALRIETIGDAPIFFDLTLIKEGAEGASMSVFEGKLFVLDRKNQALYTVTIAQKQAELVSTALPNPLYEATGQDVGFILDSDGIERIKFIGKKRDTVIETDDVWWQIGALSYFAGNLYVLDKDKRNIYKYQGTESGGFSDKRDYLALNISPDFTGVASMAIDGAVWVLFSGGRISKFLQGAPEAFSISGIDMPLSSPKEIFTDDESEYVYVLDSGNTRIVVLKKDGTYISQSRWGGIRDVTDIVVSEKEKKILLLAVSKIYAIATSHE